VQQPGQLEPGRAGLVAGSQPAGIAEAANEPADRCLVVGNPLDIWDLLVGRQDPQARWIAYDEGMKKFTVTVEDLEGRKTRTEQFDYVIVATGHFSTPNMPAYEGFEQFPGRIMHSHDFRDAREFAGKNLLVIGSSYSAEDIALQSKKYGASSVTISYRSKPMGFPWPDGIKEVPLLTKMDGNTAHFADGTTQQVDAIVMCTGYQHSFGFVEDDLRLRTLNVLYPEKLLDAVGVGLALDQLQPLLVLVGVAEHALASAEQDREHQQVVTVDQAGVGEVTGEGGAAVDDDRPPSVSLSAATSSSERRMVVSPQLSTKSSSVRVVETTYFGIAL
jgi:hypothetical protein